MGYCKEQEPTSFSVSNIFDTSSRIFASTCSWHLYTRQQTNKQTRTETECTRCRPHLLSYTLTTSSTVLHGLVTTKCKLTSSATPPRWLGQWGSQSDENQYPVTPEMTPYKKQTTKPKFCTWEIQLFTETAQMYKNVIYCTEKCFFFWDEVCTIFSLIVCNNLPNIPNPHHQGNDVPCIQTHVN